MFNILQTLSIRHKRMLLLSIVLLLSCWVIFFTGCTRQIDNAIKVDDSAGSKNAPVTNQESENAGKSSGVLLGIKSKNSGSEENSNSFSAGIKEMKSTEIQYKTLYITNNKGHVSLSAQGSDILVPRKDGFWLLNVETERLKNKYKEFAYESNIDFISAQKAGSKPAPESVKKYNSEELAQKWQEQYYPGDPKEFSNDISLELTFVGNDYITQYVENYGYTGGLHPRALQWLTTIPFTETGKIDVGDSFLREEEGRGAETEVKNVSLAELLGDEVKEQFLKVGNTHLAQGKLAYSFSLQEEGEYWGLFRQEGKWVVKGQATHSVGVARGACVIFDTEIITPQEIVSHDVLLPKWEVLKTYIPEAKDAFSSPEEDLLVVLTPEELRVYTDFCEDYIGEVTAVINLGDIFTLEEKNEIDVFMAQWAIGDNVEKWATEANKYLKDN